MTITEYQEFLDAISECFLTGDFEQWRKRLLLPFSLITQKGTVTLRTNAAAKQNFKNYLTAVQVMRLDAVHRRPISLTDCGDGTWIGTYETNLLSHGARAARPYKSSALLLPGPAGIRMSSILNARGHHEWTQTYPNQETE